MHFTAFDPTALLFASVLAGFRTNDDDHCRGHGHEHCHDHCPEHCHKDGLKRICPELKTADRGCIRYVKAFDITGVVTEVDLTFPQIKNKCDCIQACFG